MITAIEDVFFFAFISFATIALVIFKILISVLFGFVLLVYLYGGLILALLSLTCIDNNPWNYCPPNMTSWAITAFGTVWTLLVWKNLFR